MQIDPRRKEISQATTKLRLFLHEISNEHDLSANELMLILTETSADMFRVMVKKERLSTEE